MHIGLHPFGDLFSLSGERDMNLRHLKWGLHLRLFIGLLFFPVTLNALEHPLLKITNEENNLIIEFVAETDEKNDFITNFFKDSYKKGGKQKEREALDIKRLITAGLILEKRDGHEVIKLLGENFAEHNGGHITLDTLYNGATGSRKQYELELNRAGKTWEVTREGAPIEHLHLVSRKVFPLGTVGIENIVTR